MIRLALLQCAICVIAVASAIEEAAWSLPFREINFPGAGRASEQAHLWGWVAVAVTGLAFAWCTATAFRRLLVAGVLFALCYSLSFDIAYALSIGQKWNYLGQTAWWDVALRGIGSVKPFILLALIGSGNFWYRKL